MLDMSCCVTRCVLAFEDNKRCLNTKAMKLFVSSEMCPVASIPRSNPRDATAVRGQE